MSVAGPSARKLREYAVRRLGVGEYLKDPGDGRVRPEIAASALVWGLIMGVVLRARAHHAIEMLVGSPARRALGVSRSYGDDALAYFTARLDPGRTREELGRLLRQAKRGKAFLRSPRIGLALDGTGTGRTKKAPCGLCHPVYGAKGERVGSVHQAAWISVVGAGLTLPFDVEPYAPGEGEQAATHRLLERAVAELGRRYADYVVVDGLHATAPFLNRATALGLPVVARLKDNLPTLAADVEARFGAQAPDGSFTAEDKSRVEYWDHEQFLAWEGLGWKRVRVLRYRQRRPDGQVLQADWLTNYPTRRVGPRTLYRMAKSRWEIENQGFNDAKNRYGMEHITHHHENSLVVGWLVLCLALVLERLYRLRYLRRGGREPLSAITFVRLLWMSLATAPHEDDTS